MEDRLKPEILARVCGVWIRGATTFTPVQEARLDEGFLTAKSSHAWISIRLEDIAALRWKEAGGV